MPDTPPVIRMVLPDRSGTQPWPHRNASFHCCCTDTMAVDVLMVRVNVSVCQSSNAHVCGANASRAVVLAGKLLGRFRSYCRRGHGMYCRDSRIPNAVKLSFTDPENRAITPGHERRCCASPCSNYNSYDPASMRCCSPLGCCVFAQAKYQADNTESSESWRRSLARVYSHQAPDSAPSTCVFDRRKRCQQRVSSSSTLQLDHGSNLLQHDRVKICCSVLLAKPVFLLPSVFVNSQAGRLITL